MKPLVDHPSRPGKKIATKGFSEQDAGDTGADVDLSWFRQEHRRCLSRRADALYELCDAVLSERPR